MNRYEYPRLREMLKVGCAFTGDARSKAIQTIYRNSVQEAARVPENTLSDKDLLNLIYCGMGEYLKSYPAKPVFKQKLREALSSWLSIIESMYQITIDEASEEWPNYIQKDTGIEMVKMLQGRPGVTKKELASALSKTPRTIQTDLRKLDPALAEASENHDDCPLRIGGQEIHIDIRESIIPGAHGEIRYHCLNTLHPLVMQLNVTQVATMLMALQKSYDSGEYGTYCSESALDIWCQLSDYCKERVREVFAKHDADFSTFLDMLEQDIACGRFPTFKTERYMAEDATEREKLNYACKSEHPCELMLNIDGERTFYQKIRISKNYSEGYTGWYRDPKTREISTVSFTFDDVAWIEIK